MNLRIVLLLLLTVFAGAGAIYWLMLREDPNKLLQELSAQGIDISEENFVAEVRAGHADNVRRFIAGAGASAATLDKDKTSALIAAAEGKDNSILSMLLATPAGQDPATINLQDSSGRTALIAAIERGDADAMNMLLAHGANAMLANHAGETPLIVAVKHHYPKLVLPLIQADSSQHGQAITLQTTDNSGNSPLLWAIRGQDADSVKILLGAKADATAADLRGTTPLMIDAETGNEAIATLLIASGAKTDVADKYGLTPLIIAINHGHAAFVKFLIGKGADPDFHTGDKLPLQLSLEANPFDSGLFTYLLAKTKQLNTLPGTILFEAVDRKDSDIVSALLDSGLNPNVTNENGETLLYHAMQTGNQDLVLTLIDKGADISQSGVTGTSTMELAVKKNEPKVVARLLAMGAPADQKTSEGYTLAETAIYSGYPEVLSELMDKGAKVEKDFGILWAIRDGGGRAVPVLLAHGGNPNVMSGSGDPALWLAASSGETEAVQALLAHHASIDVPNKAQSTTPLAIASHSGKLGAVKLLVEAGADIEAKDAFGMTPLAHAAYMAHPDVVEYLLSKGANSHAADAQGRGVAELASLATASPERDKVMALLNKR